MTNTNKTATTTTTATTATTTTTRDASLTPLARHLGGQLARRLLHLLAFCGLLALLGGCGAATVTPAAPPHRATRLPQTAPELQVSVRRGDARVLHAGAESFTALTKGQRARGVVALRGGAAPVLLGLHGASGREQGKLWLRAGAELRWGLTAQGELRLALARGEARLSIYSATRAVTLLAGQGRHIALAGQDVRIWRAGDAVRATPTANAPAAAAWTLALLEDARGAGVGSLEVRRRVASGAASRAKLSLRSLAVTVKTHGYVAETHVEHVFINTSSERLEGTFRFPLPAGASLLGLAMEIKDKLMEGELVERTKARKTYESIVDSMRDPALLEWEQGNVFKLRVFPIEPQKTKRVVLRYLAPIDATAQRVFRYDTAAPGLQQRIPRFSLVVDGKTVADAKDFKPGRSLAVQLADTKVQALREARADGVYTAVRLRPDWSRLRRAPSAKVPATTTPTSAPKKLSPASPRDLLLLVDSSRSALEARPLQLAAVQTLLETLRPEDRFLVVATDLTTRDHAPRFTSTTVGARRGALAFLRAIEPDGASDLGAALTHAGQLLRARGDRSRRAQLVYLGDGTATWGVTERAKLERLSAGALDETPLHALVLGKGASRELLCGLAARQGGRCMRPRTQTAVRQLALALSRPEALRLANVTLRAGEHDEVFPRQARTLFFGESITAYVRTPAGKAAPTQLTMTARFAGQPVVLSFACTAVAPAKHVAHRWARAKLAQLAADGADKKTVVATSLRYGVMSKHTSFLVLESEQAYKRWGIERKNKARFAAAPKVSGADLESVSGQRARLSPDHFQPGDPEVRIPAPANAKSVVVVFPFGETKVANYERALRAWTVRFLVAHGTPDGTYQVTVRVTHQDDRVEILKLSYVVDSTAPLVTLKVIKRRRGYSLTAHQVVTRRELLLEQQRALIHSGSKAKTAGTISDPRATRSGGPKHKLARYAHVAQDIKRVEVRLPSGKVLKLYHHKLGSFVGRWRPRTALTTPVELTVVATDRAQNRRVERLRFDPRSGTLSSLEVRR
jgi:hypothetical protein